MFKNASTRHVSLGTAESMPDGRVFYRLNTTMSLPMVPVLRLEIFEVINQFKPSKLILELERLHRFGGAGLAILVELLQHMPPEGKIYLVHVHKMARGMIEIGQLQNLFIIADDLPRDEIIELLSGSTCPVDAPAQDHTGTEPSVDIKVS